MINVSHQLKKIVLILEFFYKFSIPFSLTNLAHVVGKHESNKKKSMLIPCQIEQFLYICIMHF